MLIESLFAILSAALEPPAQPLYTTPYFRTLGVAAGLPSSRVYKTVQDRDGYLWIGTHDGLARYDGNGIRVYRHDPADPGSIAGDVVSALFVDAQNRIWCGGEDSGLNMLDARREKFVHFRHDPSVAQSLGSDDVWTVASDAQGSLWVGAYAGGVDRLDAFGFTHFRHDPHDPHSIASDNVLTVAPARSGGLWIGSDAGLDLLGDDGARHVDFSAVPGEGRINAIAIFDEAERGIVVGTRRGVLRVGTDLKASVLVDAALSDRVVYSLARPADDSSELWIATRHGVDFRKSDGAITAFVENAAVPGSIPGDTVFDAMRDREGGLWFTTFEGGVTQLPPQWRNFSLFRSDPADAHSLSANRVQGLAVADDGKIWSVNSAGGIDLLDAATGKVERFAETASTPDKALWAVLPDRFGQLWVGHTRGLRVYNLHSGKFADLDVDAKRRDALAPGLVDHLIAGNDGALWTCSNGAAIERINAVTHVIERFDADNSGLRNGTVSQIGFDTNGNLLVAGAAGLDRFDFSARRFAPLPGAPKQSVLAFAFGVDHSLWVHVQDALEHYSVDATGLQPLERVDAKDGWPSLTAGGMQVDLQGAVWVSSPRGLWRYDPRSRKVRAYSTGDGLASSEFNQRPLVRRDDGSIFGGTLAGIVGFDPVRIVEDHTPAPPLLDEVRVRRQSRDMVLDPTTGGSLSLEWNDRDVHLQARSLSFANPSALRYQWQLSGVDTDWVDTGNRGEREFAQLPAGRHRLQLRTANAGGVWSEIVSPLSLDQAAAPWATRSAFALYALAVALIAWLMLRSYRARVLRSYTLKVSLQQRQFAEQASAAKTTFLATMGHEIRTPMTGVLGMTELLLHTPLSATQRGYAETIANSGRLMLRLVNDSLDLARIEAGKLELENLTIDLPALLHSLAALAQPLAQAKGLLWQLDIASDVPQWVNADASRLQQILLNLINNAIKFTQQGAVALHVSRHAGDIIEFLIVDTGIGIDVISQQRLFARFEQASGTQRHQGSGLGLAISRELALRMGGDISLRSTPGEGSRFLVRLKLEQADSPAPASLPSNLPLRSTNSGLQILLVEDDLVVAQVMRELLQLQGHQIVHASHALAALSELASSTFDLALVDLDLPDVDGLAFARIVRANELTTGRSCLPMVGVSARSGGDEESLSLAAGMNCFVRKPVSGAMLAELITQYVVPD